MQIIKLDSLINNPNPQKVATPLGEPSIKLSPVVQTLKNNVGDSFDSFVADGYLTLSNLTFTDADATRKGTASLVDDGGKYGIRINDRYDNIYQLPINTDITILMEFKVNELKSSRIFMIGQSQNQVLLTASSTSFYCYYPNGTTQSAGIILDSAINKTGVNKIALLIRSGLMTVIVNGIEFSAVAQQLFGTGTHLTLNGRRSLYSEFTDVTFYGLEIYEGTNITKARVLEYYF